MPKSASSTLSHRLAAAGGVPETNLGEPNRESDFLQLGRLVEERARGLAHQHVHATPRTLELISIFDLQVVVHTRNVFDAIVSLRDHFLSGEMSNPIGYVPDHFTELDSEQQLLFVTDLAAPWLLGFVKSWEEAEQNGTTVIWTDFETVSSRPGLAARSVIASTGSRIHESELAAAVAGPPRRFNVGRAGRGSELLPASAVLTVHRLAEQYRIQNGAIIGL
jgi:hypothetical protein